MTVIPGLLANLPGKLPLAPIPDDADFQTAAKSVLNAFPNLEVHQFAEDAIWRDSFALTGTFRTFYSGPKAAKIWQLLSSQRKISRATFDETAVVLTRVSETNAWIEIPFTFSTSNPATACSGTLSLVPGEDGNWKIWLMKTILDQLPGHGNVDDLRPLSTSNGAGVELNGSSKEVKTGLQIDIISGAKEEELFQCIIIGGGQAGLSIGGRLQALGVKYVILEKLHHVGDSWRQRYQTARCTSPTNLWPQHPANCILQVHTIREFCLSHPFSF